MTTDTVNIRRAQQREQPHRRFRMYDTVYSLEALRDMAVGQTQRHAADQDFRSVVVFGRVVDNAPALLTILRSESLTRVVAEDILRQLDKTDDAVFVARKRKREQDANDRADLGSAKDRLAFSDLASGLADARDAEIYAGTVEGKLDAVNSRLDSLASVMERIATALETRTV